MTRRCRWFSALAAAAALAPLSILDTGPRPVCGRDLDPRAESCGQCHVEQHREWKGRAHHRAWTDEIYQAELKTKTRQQQCTPCHIPTSVHGRLGKKPETRDVRQEEGVTCVSCHEHKGKILGPFGAATEAHESTKSDAFSRRGSVELCASCHGTSIADILGVAKDWQTLFEKDEAAKTCIECHMPEVERPLAIDPATGKATTPARAGRQHTVLGPDDAEFCAKAFELSVRTDGDRLVLTVANRAGHRVPGFKLRTFKVGVGVGDAAGKNLAEHAFEISGKDPLPGAATRDFAFARPAGAAKLSVRIAHVMMDVDRGVVLEPTLDV